MKIVYLIGVCLLMAGFASADDVTVVIDDDINGWTQIEAGAGNNTVKDGLTADDGTALWGVSNALNKDGMLYNSYSNIVDGSNLPSTIQAGTYTLSLRVGNGNVYDFSGLNDISSGINTERGAVAGFFSTLDANADSAKNNMYTEFIAVDGVSYTAPVEAAPVDLSWTTWTFKWEVTAGSSVVGSDPYFGVFNKTGGDGAGSNTYGSAFFDNSTLSFIAATKPEILMISVNFHVGDDDNAQADHELTGSEAAGIYTNIVWNNINAGIGGINSSVLATNVLTDNSGDSNAATFSQIGTGTKFVGYAASASAANGELELDGTNHDDLFNSYIAFGLAGDLAGLLITNLGSAYTKDGYDVIVYADTDRRGTSNNPRRSVYTLTPSGGSALTRFNEDDDINGDTYNIFDGTYILSDNVEDGADYSNYTVFSKLTAGSFTLSVHSPDGGRGGISGFQIVSRSSKLKGTVILVQ